MSLILPLFAPPTVYFGDCDVEKGELNFKIDPSHDLWVYSSCKQSDFEQAFSALVNKWKHGRKIDWMDAQECRRLVQLLVDQFWAQGYARSYRKREVANA